MKFVSFMLFFFVIMSSLTTSLRLKTKHTNSTITTLSLSKHSQSEMTFYQRLSSITSSIKSSMISFFNFNTTIENETYLNIYNTLSITILLIISLGLIVLMLILYYSAKQELYIFKCYIIYLHGFD